MEERVEFTTPFNVQAVSLKDAINISWQWEKPISLPVFKEFGFEVRRTDGKTWFSKTTAFQDGKLTPGSYAYAVRVRALTKEKGKHIYLVSEWSETVGGKIVAECPGPPRIELAVTPTQQVYSSISSLRFRLKGIVHSDPICGDVLGGKYLIDTGRGLPRQGPVKFDKQGKYDIFVNALGPEDEIPTGVASFSVSVTAENTAGPTTSDVYTLDIALQNPYAPH